jgi:hypothetical protein
VWSFDVDPQTTPFRDPTAAASTQAAQPGLPGIEVSGYNSLLSSDERPPRPEQDGDGEHQMAGLVAAAAVEVSA